MGDDSTVHPETKAASVYDPLSLGFSVLFLALIAVFASLIPALRAIRIDPVRALRD